MNALKIALATCLLLSLARPSFAVLNPPPTKEKHAAASEIIQQARSTLANQPLSGALNRELSEMSVPIEGAKVVTHATLELDSKNGAAGREQILTLWRWDFATHKAIQKKLTIQRDKGRITGILIERTLQKKVSETLGWYQSSDVIGADKTRHENGRSRYVEGKVFVKKTGVTAKSNVVNFYRARYHGLGSGKTRSGERKVHVVTPRNRTPYLRSNPRRRK